ncbi:MAG: ribosomal RNA small subunit methyltransferase A [Chitinivibrionales bacterium]|nr:ribosomal RNA small subunit methyltransferase A [Chitinivibrionales bacterium]
MPPKKKYGQHFLTAPYYARKIADAVPACADEPVLEIGPGRGALSIYLKERFPHLHLVEVDKDVIPGLKEKLGEGSWSLHCCDVLQFDFALAGVPLHVAGNLPYNLAAMIIKKTLLMGNDILSCTFMVQKEVAQRITAEPGSSHNGFLAIFCQFFGRPHIVCTVPPGAFFPRPAVDSSVFQIKIYDKLCARLPRVEWSRFFAFVSLGFGQRRKKLVNALASQYDKLMVEKALVHLNQKPDARPQVLDISDWLELFKSICCS